MIDIFDTIHDISSDNPIDTSSLDSMSDMTIEPTSETEFGVDHPMLRESLSYHQDENLFNNDNFNNLSQISFGQGESEYGIDVGAQHEGVLSNIIDNTSDFLHHHLPQPVQSAIRFSDALFDEIKDALIHSTESIDNFFDRFNAHEAVSNSSKVEMPINDLVSERPLTYDERIKIDAEINKLKSQARRIELQNDFMRLDKAHHDDIDVNVINDRYGLPHMPIYEQTLNDLNQKYNH